MPSKSGYSKDFWAGWNNGFNKASVMLAQKHQPEGKFCYRCKKENDMADDCGWFYHWKSGEPDPAVCQACWDELGLTTGER